MGVERAVLDHQVTKRTKVVQDGGAVLGTAHGKGAQGHMVTTVLEFKVRATAADGSTVLDRFYWDIPDAHLNKGRLAWREDGEEVSVDICLTEQLTAAIAARAADRGLREEYETALAYATAGDLAETNALARARRGRPRGGWPDDERLALRDFHRMRVIQWTVGLVILAIIAVTIWVVVVASLDDPAPTRPVVGASTSGSGVPASSTDRAWTPSPTPQQRCVPAATRWATTEPAGRASPVAVCADPCRRGRRHDRARR